MTQQFHSQRVLKGQVYTKTRTPRITAALLVTAPKRSQPKCPAMEGGTHKMRVRRKPEYYSAIKMHEAWTPVTTWMNLENILRGEKARTKRS